MNQTEPCFWNCEKKEIWRMLHQRFGQTPDLNIQKLLSEDSDRVNKLSIDTGALHFDFSKNLIDDEALKLLLSLAKTSDLRKKIDRLLSGEQVNNSECRAALHSLLRLPPQYHLSESKSTDTVKKYTNLAVQHKKVHDVLQKIERFVTGIHHHKWLGYTGKPITHIVNIGVGGSDLGPKLACHALNLFKVSGLTCLFVSNIDDTNLGRVLNEIPRETTLFVIASKSFSTPETMSNSNNAKAWFLEEAVEEDIRKHFVAVSSNIEKTVEFGVDPDNVFPMWDWVGGRYSLWSAIGITIALSIGMKNFKGSLQGAYEMDQHFQNTPLNRNAPVIAALIGIFYGNILGAQSHAVIPYDENLSLLPDYLQQLDMESNGKQVTQNGQAVSYRTGMILWGNTGSSSQHSFHQLLHQGTQFCGIDFILPLQSHYNIGHQHRSLVANCLAQIRALMCGKSVDEAKKEMVERGAGAHTAELLAAHKAIAGNKPSTLICYNKITPQVLGQLIAFYEHKVYVQSVIWEINAFDQWGVELGKQLCDSLEPFLSSNSLPLEAFDNSTAKVIERYRQLNLKEI